VRVGGRSEFLALPETLEELKEVLRCAVENKLPVTTLGRGGNVVVADEGVAGLAIRLIGDFREIELLDDGRTLRAGGAASNQYLARFARDRELGGLEFAKGIPGTAGGSVRMNAGAYGGEFAGVVSRALVVTSAGAKWRDIEKLELSHRRSGLADGEVVAEVELTLLPRRREEIEAIERKNEKDREDNQPTTARTFGSVFINPSDEHADPALKAAWRYIADSGLQGRVARSGRARISEKHANFIENLGGATARDVIEFDGFGAKRGIEERGPRVEARGRLLRVGCATPYRLNPQSSTPRHATRRLQLFECLEKKPPHLHADRRSVSEAMLDAQAIRRERDGEQGDLVNRDIGTTLSDIGGMSCRGSAPAEEERECGKVPGW
jgi:UDP-N-acetylmuramate dehydrogenase